jgi:hypothetical protein
MTSAARRRSIGKRLGDFVSQQLTQAQKCLASAGETRHQGVHEARKCMRRVRAAWGILARKRPQSKGALAVAAIAKAKKMDETIVKLCRSLSTLRDAKALDEALQRLSPTKAVSEPGLTHSDRAASMLTRAQASAAAVREQALQRALSLDPGLARRRAKLKVLLAQSAELPWSEITEHDLAAAVKRSQRRAKKAEKRARRDATDDDLWHRFRKRVRRVRRVRHQHFLLHAIASKPNSAGTPSNSRLDTDAAELGESQDDALLLRFCKLPAVFDHDVCRWLRGIAKARLQRTRQAVVERKGECLKS